MNARFRLILVALGACAFNKTPSIASDVICGPRCVHFVCHQYKMDVPLFDLVKELQWPDISHGCSIDDIQRSLTKRGLATLAVSGSEVRDAIRYGEFAIAFIAPKNGGVLGHFVVMHDEPTLGPSIIFDGAADNSIDAESLNRISNAVLLVSSKPIVLNEHLDIWDLSWYLVVCGIALLIIVARCKSVILNVFRCPIFCS